MSIAERAFILGYILGLGTGIMFTYVICNEGRNRK